jgi:hypothetical protein
VKRGVSSDFMVREVKIGVIVAGRERDVALVGEEVSI